MDRKLALFVLTHAIVVSFIIFHVLRVINWYVLSTHAFQIITLSIIALLIPKKFKMPYIAFLLYYFLTTSTWFNNWIIALPNYLVREITPFAAIATVAALASLYVHSSPRKLLMVATFLSGLVYAYWKGALALILHVSLALTFLISLVADMHFLVWAVNYILYFMRLRKGTV